ncbi:hypothetical protein NEOLI_004470 [Neolecta irregularis DAH-3]|uniref:Uncharacterized protein n=1 Tax=Neolecta irregularis (strain DAH-3) TaxID=1198029 RepID=A0A1U7LKS9_NEOID|nr:hypothetical protein NEOLI_004470 [Neolecta irregularis DAH-3]|eukprot:OLL23249.1 hypothetical protein NEOLI_004470 [Neolecta irregularis DAH-3]
MDGTKYTPVPDHLTIIHIRQLLDAILVEERAKSREKSLFDGGCGLLPFGETRPNHHGLMALGKSLSQLVEFLIIGRKFFSLPKSSEVIIDQLANPRNGNQLQFFATTTNREVEPFWVARSIQSFPPNEVDLILLSEEEETEEDLRRFVLTWRPPDPMISLERMFIDPYGESIVNKFRQITKCFLEYTPETDVVVLTGNNQESLDKAVERLERMYIYATRTLPATAMLFHLFVESQDFKINPLKQTPLYQRTILESNSKFFEIKMREKLKILRATSKLQRDDNIDASESGVADRSVDNTRDPQFGTRTNLDTTYRPLLGRYGSNDIVPPPCTETPLSSSSSLSSPDLEISLSMGSNTVLDCGFQNPFLSHCDSVVTQHSEGVRGLSAIFRKLQNNISPLEQPKKQYS